MLIWSWQKLPAPINADAHPTQIQKYQNTPTINSQKMHLEQFPKKISEYKIYILKNIF